MDAQTIIMVLIELFAGASVFLVGVKLLSSNIEQLATTGIKDIFNKTANNKIVNVGIGMVTTALVQSSGLTTVLIVGFVNVGLISLAQATAMIMGANIGTTLTAQIAALSAFEFSKYIKIIAFVGILMTMISKKETIKKAGFIITGLGLIFIGLGLMSASLTPLKEEASDVFTLVTNPFLMFLIGIFLTALVQSSAAITSILISIAAAGLQIGDGGNSVLFIILGTNIGSCVTALMSSFGASPNAKRASLIHLLFNTFGSLIFFIVLLIFPGFMDVTFGKWFKETATQIAMFHTFFNVIGTIVFLPFTNVFVKIATFLVKDKPVKEENITLLDERIIQNTSLAIEQVEKETMRLADIAMQSFRSAYKAFYDKNADELSETVNNISVCDKMSKQITNYLIKVSLNTGLTEEKKINDIHNNIGDIMRIAEIADNFTKYTRHEVEDNLTFSDGVKEELNEMVSRIENLFNLTKEAVLTKNSAVINEIDVVEESVDAMRKHLIDSHIERLNRGDCAVERGTYFFALISAMERIADHLVNVAYSIKNPTGSQSHRPELNEVSY